MSKRYASTSLSRTDQGAKLAMSLPAKVFVQHRRFLDIAAVIHQKSALPEYANNLPLQKQLPDAWGVHLYYAAQSSSKPSF